jgi:predicted TIM-barrel fold metal-dependent hydrolase
MVVDFQHHYTPSELMEMGKGDGSLRLDESGNPNYRFNPLLADLSAHVRMMDKASIDLAVLSCGSGFDQPNLTTCRLINDRMHQAERDHPGRFIGLAHVPVLNSQEAEAELKRCAVELGFPGVVIASEIQGHPLDAPSLRPFWRAAADLDLYVFIHPPPQLVGWAYMDVDDLWRMLGWEFSLMVATVRLINSGILDELPSLKIHVSHFGGGIARYLPRIRGLQDREKSGTAKIPRHSRTPREAFDHYLQQRLYYDCAGWSGPDYAAKRGAEWVRVGLAEVPPSQVVFATDYPQAVRDDDEVAAYVKAVAELGTEARKILDGTNAEQLIPNLKDRLNRVTPESRPPG